MPVHDLESGAAISGLATGDVLVCIPLFGAHEQFVTCLDRVLAHSPERVPILIADDQTPDPRSREYAERLVAASRRAVYWHRNRSNVGFVENVNQVFEMGGDADVVVVNSDVEVAAGWLEGLTGAAGSGPGVATVTVLTNHGTIVSVPERNTPSPGLPAGVDLDRAAARVRTASERLRPVLPTAIGHCMLITRAALDAVGGFDLAFSPGYGEEVDFSRRCVAAGMRNVLADDVLVLHHGSSSFGAISGRDELQQAHELLIAERYPDYHPEVVAAAGDEHSDLARALRTASAQITGDQRTARRGWLQRLRSGR